MCKLAPHDTGYPVNMRLSVFEVDNYDKLCSFM